MQNLKTCYLHLGRVGCYVENVSGLEGESITEIRGTEFWFGIFFSEMGR